MFQSFSDKCDGYACEPVYGVQWALTTDGHNGTTGRDIALHVGTGKQGVKTVEINSIDKFNNIEAVKITAWMTDAYKVTVIVGDKTFYYGSDQEDPKYVLHTFPVDDVTGKISVTFEYSIFHKKAMYLQTIEVVTGLDDKKIIEIPKNMGATRSYTVKRIFSKDYWNTVCLPFDVKAEDLKDIFGNGEKSVVSLREFTGKVDGNTMIFKDATEIQAGVPYLLKPTKTVENPTFSNVVYTEETPHVVEDATGMFSFVGTYNPKELQTDGSELFLGDGDKLYKPSTSGNRMNGLRAFFRIRKSSSAPAKGEYSIAFEDETTTVKTIDTDKRLTCSRTYTLQGIAVDDTKPLPPGIYIKNGKKYVRK
ncbi:MAG: hypothetical protein ACOYJK_09965 [Prevotella sp.]